MNRIRIGTSGWAYSSWKPDFYPQKTPSAKFLNFYATQLNCVEVNYTLKSEYSESTLNQLESRLAKVAEQCDVYAFLKHEETPEGALNARRLLQNLEQRDPYRRIAS